MIYGSICSGIEAATTAWHPLGWKPAWFAEIDPFASSVLSHHWPEIENLGDMTRIAESVRVGDVEAPDLIVGGTPCQAFSVAGMRAGLEDARGQLTLEYVRLADAIDMERKSDGKEPTIIVWENVPGVLSSKDNAFGCFLAGLAGEDDPLIPSGKKWGNAGCVYGPKRAIAWRILDAQYFGLAQRRRRVFLVASARAGFDPAEVLFEREGVRRDTAPSRKTGQDVAGTLNARTDGGGFPGTDEACSGYVQPVTQGFRMAAFGEYSSDGTASTMKARDYKDATDLVVHGTQDPDICIDHTHPLGRNSGRENAVFSIQNATRGKSQNGLGISVGTPMYTLDQASQHAVFAIQAGALRTNPLSGPDGVGVQSDHAYTLEARAEVQAVCVTGEVTHTLKADGFDGSGDGTGRGQPIVSVLAFQERGRANGPELEIGGDVAYALTAPSGGGRAQERNVLAGSAVRRLTPAECEKLQGFPVGHTDVPYRNKPAADGPRYKAIGNSKAVPVVRWLGERIANYLATYRDSCDL